jgi:hypothetical protein
MVRIVNCRHSAMKNIRKNTDANVQKLKKN